MPKAAAQHDGWSYFRRYRRCNPPCGGCIDGPGHGPYWWRAKRVNGRVKHEYLGKNLPEGITVDEID